MVGVWHGMAGYGMVGVWYGRGMASLGRDM